MNMKSILGLLVAVLLIQADSSASGASFKVYSSKADFLAALSAPPTLVTFEGSDTSGGTPGYTTYGPGGSFGPGGILTQSAGTLYAVTSGFGPTNNDGDTNVVFDGGSGGTMTINVACSAFAVDIMNLGVTPNAFSLTYTGDGGFPLNFTITGSHIADTPPPGFLGVISITGEFFTSMIFPPNSTASNTPYFDNVILSIVPEPGSLALFGLGAIGLFVAARRCRPRSSAV
jgi:hypothetical protein